jgi:3-deoxy-7-phosphoheptulonate synthase
MNGTANQEDIEKIVDKLKSMGLDLDISKGEKRSILGIIGDTSILESFPFYAYAGVEKVLRVLKPFKLASREFKNKSTSIKLKGITIGGKELAIMAGPCAIENEEQIFTIAGELSKRGVKILRGGAFKPRTSPYSFQGLGEEGLKLMSRAAREFGLSIITEVMSVEQVDLVAEYADILQVGARNMQNFMLLKELGRIKKPVMLKRGMSATIEELLLSAEHILSNGNRQVILCERGIRTFETYTRNTLDLSAVPSLKELSHLPVIVDPSHGTGRWKLVGPMAKSAIVAGADGLMIEVHPNPKAALSDGAQTLNFKNFSQLLKEMSAIANVTGREIILPVR